MSEHGQSAVVIPVPAAEPLVSGWRGRFDPSAAEGMPAHITVLYPFLPRDRLTDGVLEELRSLCGPLHAIEVTFARAGRFPRVLYLDPQPGDRLRALIGAIARQWPEAPPYGGAYDDVVPHLTVAADADDATLDAIEADLAPRLPVSAALTEARLYVFDGVRWQPVAELPFLSGVRSQPCR